MVISDTKAQDFFKKQLQKEDCINVVMWLSDFYSPKHALPGPHIGHRATTPWHEDSAGRRMGGIEK